MNIRQAKIEDKEKILNIISLLYLDIPHFVWNTDPFVTAQIQNNEYFVIEDQNQIAGIMSLRKRKDKIHIETLAVKKDFQNKGLGSQLIEFAKDFAKENNFKTLQAYSFTQYQAEGFYKKLGFTALTYSGEYKRYPYNCFEIKLTN